MAASLPTTLCLSHGDECCKRSPKQGYALAVKRNLMGGYSRLCVGTTVRRLVVTAATEGSRKSKESQPSWANPDSDEPPPWAREEGRSSTSQESIEIPFYVYLLASAITAIAAVCFPLPLIVAILSSVDIKDLDFMYVLQHSRSVLFLSTRVRIQCSESWNLTVSFILLCLGSLHLLESPLL